MSELLIKTEKKRYGRFETWAESLPSQGRYSFTRDEVMNALQFKRKAFIQAARRLAAKKRIVRIHGRFYVVVPMEYTAIGVIPAEWFINELMLYFKQPYYVGGLSAAEVYGAAHQRPQWYQIVTNRPIRDIECKGVGIRFFVKQDIAQTPTRQLKVVTGYLPVSTPEATAFDLVQYARRLGGLDHVCTVLQELGELIDPVKLFQMTKNNGQVATAQRLGWLLEKAGFGKKCRLLQKWVRQMKPPDIKLAPSLPIGNAQHNASWNLWINMDIEGDLA